MSSIALINQVEEKLTQTLISFNNVEEQLKAAKNTSDICEAKWKELNDKLNKMYAAKMNYSASIATFEAKVLDFTENKQECIDKLTANGNGYTYQGSVNIIERDIKNINREIATIKKLQNEADEQILLRDKIVSTYEPTIISARLELQAANRVYESTKCVINELKRELETLKPKPTVYQKFIAYFKK